MKENKVLNCLQENFEKLNINIHSFTNINIILIIVASIVCSVGLLTNNYQSVIASKIIGLAIIPFISLCIIIFSGNITKIMSSAGNCILFILLCLIIGVFIGFINASQEYITEPTNEMLSRATFKYETIYLELGMSFIVGIGIYYSIIKNSIVAFIGLLLVVSILPPICNAGLFYGMNIYHSWKSWQSGNSNNSNPTEKYNLQKEIYLSYANHSMVLFLTDIIGVFFGFLSVYIFNCIG